MTVNYDPARIDPLFAALYRSFTLLRRVLLKGEDRYHMFCRNILLASVEQKNITGPVHGFIHTCEHLHIKISKIGDDLFIESPYGTGILIKSLDRTLFNSIIRDSINYTILNQLHQRTSSDTDPNYRKDQPFTGASGSFPGLSGLLKIGVSDLFEDFKWIGGIRLAGSLQNSTFVVSHKNLERKVDREWIIERQGNEGVSSDLGALTRTHTHAVHYRRTIPFSETMSLRAQFTYRLDRVSLLATDPFNASRDDLYMQGIGGIASRSNPPPLV